MSCPVNFIDDSLNSDLGLSVLKMTSESLPTRLDSVATSFQVLYETDEQYEFVKFDRNCKLVCYKGW